MDSRKKGGGRGLVVMAGRGPQAGMAVTDAGLVSAGLARAGRPREGEQRGERGDPVPGCILPRTASLQTESQRASGGWLTLPLVIPIIQALLLCFQPWFLCYLLTLHSIEDDNEFDGGREKSHTSVLFQGDMGNKMAGALHVKRWIWSLLLHWAVLWTVSIHCQCNIWLTVPLVWQGTFIMQKPTK